MDERFTSIIAIIKNARTNAIKAVNTELINLYWNVGEYITNQIESNAWGKSIVEALAKHIENQEPELKGFSDKNLWRMKQFYETYRNLPKLSPFVRELSWTNNLVIISRTKSQEELEFYLNICKQERYSKRELERQISSSLFERTMLDKVNISPVARELHPTISDTYKDSYVFDFLNLNSKHSESGLQKGLLQQMKNLY